jgi:penicillin-binding protein 1A
VTLQELLTAYSAFPGQGERVEPYLIEKVLDRYGNLIEEHQVKKEEVISAKTAYLMTDLLQGVVREGTGTKAKELKRPAAGKTGTTNELKDAWFIGFTPSVLTGVWVGYDDHTVSLGNGETGGHAACPIWVYFMKEYLENKPVETFQIPEGIIFAKINGSSGAVAGSDEEGAVYAASADKIPAPGSRPKLEGEEGSAEVPANGETDETQPRLRQVQPSSNDSYFKSELY